MTLRSRASLFSLGIAAIALILAGLMAVSIHLVLDIDARTAEVSRLRGDIILAESLTTEVLLDGGDRPIAQWRLLSQAVRVYLGQSDGMFATIPALRNELVSRIQAMDQAFARLAVTSKSQSPTVRAVLVMQLRANKDALLSRLEEIEAGLRAQTGRTYQWLVAAAVTAICLLLALAAGNHWLGRRYLLSVFEEVSRAIGGITAGHLEQPIRTTRTGEVGDLLASLDDMRGRLHVAMTQQERQRQKAEELSRAKSDFVASVSHELRTPLTGLLGRLDLAQRRGTLAEVQADVDCAQDAGAHLLALVNQVLEFSRIESGHLDLVAKSFGPVALVQSVVSVMSIQAERKGLALTVSGRGDGQALLLGDEQRLSQVLLNLVGNAIKFTPAGSVAIDYAVGDIVAGRRTLSVAVRDTGPGIPPASRAAVFDDFIQLGQTGDATQSGAGLGLAISARLIRLMGGTIAVADAAGGGADFHFAVELPVALPEPVRAGRRRPQPETPLTVLVVEDVSFNRDVIREFLLTAGHRVIEACDGQQALDRLQDGGPVDAVLMDINMPVMDGLEATRRIRAAPASWSGVPIVGLTANVFNEQVRNYIDAGMTSCIAKPVVWNDLFDQLEKVTSGRTAAATGLAADLEPQPPAEEIAMIDPQQFRDFVANLGEAQAVRSHAEALDLLRTQAAILVDRRPDPGRVVQIARSLRGVAANFGFLRIAARAAEVEQEALAGRVDAGGIAGLSASVEATRAESSERAIAMFQIGS